jgi:hypothetical protein
MLGTSRRFTVRMAKIPRLTGLDQLAATNATRGTAGNHRRERAAHAAMLRVLVLGPPNRPIRDRPAPRAAVFVVHVQREEVRPANEADAHPAAAPGRRIEPEPAPIAAELPVRGRKELDTALDARLHVSSAFQTRGDISKRARDGAGCLPLRDVAAPLPGPRFGRLMAAPRTFEHPTSKMDVLSRKPAWLTKMDV